MNQSNALPAASPARSPVSPLWVGLWLAVVLVGAKAVLLGVPRSPQWLLKLAMASFQDVLFAVAVGAIGEMAVRAAARRPTLARAVRGAMLGFLTLCAFYGVVAVGVFQYFDRPLSYDLLRMVQNAATMRSSITERITVTMAVAFVGVPALFLTVALWRCRRQHLPMVALAGAGVWVAAGWWQHAGRPGDMHARRLVLNPHVELVRSTVVGLTGARRVTFPVDFSPEDTIEFRSFGARGGAPTEGFEPPAGIARPRNVIVIVLESVGTKYMSLYGSRYETTPNLVAESAHALVFDNFYSHLGYTFCSFVAINFSMHPGLPWCYAPAGGGRLPPSLASVLRARGWRTVYLQNGEINWFGPDFNLENFGYDEVHDYHEFGCPPLSSWGAEDRFLIDRLLRWIDQKRGQPFLAVCWTDQTHDPYAMSPGVATVDFFHDKPPAANAADLSRYLNVLRETDRQLGRLFAALRERGLADDTMVVVTGDHGEAFHDPHDQRGHGFTVYQEDVHVPLMLWNPRLFPAGRRVATVGAHMDINPTIADLLAVEPVGEWQGRSLFDPARPPRAYFMAGIGDYLFGLRESQWKYILNTTRGREMLFDLEHDPDEQHNAATAEPERCRRLRQRIAAWVTFEDEFLRGRTN
jgi:arylsulfatase A-like enzyme